MLINEIDVLESKLKHYGIEMSAVCLVTSATLSINNIRENNDLEFVLKCSARLLLEKQFEGQYNKFSGFIRLSESITCVINPYNLFGISDEDLFDNRYSIQHGQYRVVRLELYAAKKMLQNRKKDEIDIKRIKALGFWNTQFDVYVNQLLNVAMKSGYMLPKVSREELWESIKKENELFIFGTGYMARSLYKRMIRENIDSHVKGFIVSKEQEEDFLLKKKKFLIDKFADKDALVLVAVEFVNMIETTRLLRDNGFTKLIEAYMFWE